METRNRLTAARAKWARGKDGKNGKGTVTDHI